MGQTTAAARYRRLGDELRRHRLLAGLSSSELAERTGWSKVKIWRIESGHLEIDTVDVIHFLGECGMMRGQVLDLLAEFHDAERNHEYWLAPYGQYLEDSVCSLIFHEATASSSVSYDPQLIPGLLQTETYARATIERFDSRTGDDLTSGVRARLQRQRVLYRSKPGRFTFFVHEHALRATIGDPSVMQEQLLALMFADGLPHVSVRVVPASAMFGGAFRLFNFARHSPLVYLNGQLAGLFIEDKEYVRQYELLIPRVADAALDERESRLFIAALASEFDRGSLGDLEEEQLQRGRQH